MPILLATALALGIVLANTSARAQAGPIATTMVPQARAAACRPGTRGGSGVDGGTVITRPRTSTTLAR
jgi:hypothetical protein